MKNRRVFVKKLMALFLASGLAPAVSGAQGQVTAKKTILLCSSWQTFNIGDIAHTPGLLAILEKYLPNVNVILWPHDVGNGVKGILNKHFPKVRIVTTEEEVSKAFEEAAFLLHGSGPSLVGRGNIARWIKETGKPFGVYGITFPGVYAAKGVPVKAREIDVELLNKASFVYFRDSPSLHIAKDSNIHCPIMEFAPESSFAVDLENDATAIAFIKKNGLEEGKFLCCIPRYRFTEEWLAKGKNRPYNQEHVDYNNQMKDHDNGPLREAITQVVRRTSMKILICPEDETHVALGKSLILDQLPPDVKPNVVWRDTYWLTDEALSVYKRSAGLFGLEMHSPIMCIGHGIPAIVCRFYEQTTKGYMWKDIGLGEWLFDMDIPSEVEKIVPTVLTLAEHPNAAKKKAQEASAFVRKEQKRIMGVIQKVLNQL